MNKTMWEPVAAGTAIEDSVDGRDHLIVDRIDDGTICYLKLVRGAHVNMGSVMLPPDIRLCRAVPATVPQPPVAAGK